ncbi:Adenosylcobinamide kinase/adenosylcobinamide phosphate guanyltransferase [Tenacibaculum halocynthiae]
MQYLSSLFNISMIYYITGGERSGKSSYAQKLAESLSDTPIYLATSRIWDDNFKERVERHISDRDDRWTTIEEEKLISTFISEKQTVVIDCVTLWLTNFYLDTKNDVQLSLELAKKEIDKLAQIDANIIIISNEIGMGLHAQTEVGRKFTELQGWTNQYISKHANKAIFMVSGLPLTLK